MPKRMRARPSRWSARSKAKRGSGSSRNGASASPQCARYAGAALLTRRPPARRPSRRPAWLTPQRVELERAPHRLERGGPRQGQAHPRRPRGRSPRRGRRSGRPTRRSTARTRASRSRQSVPASAIERRRRAARRRGPRARAPGRHRIDQLADRRDHRLEQVDRRRIGRGEALGQRRARRSGPTWPSAGARPRRPSSRGCRRRGRSPAAGRARPPATIPRNASSASSAPDRTRGLTPGRQLEPLEQLGGVAGRAGGRGAGDHDPSPRRGARASAAIWRTVSSTRSRPWARDPSAGLQAGPERGHRAAAGERLEPAAERAGHEQARRVGADVDRRDRCGARHEIVDPRGHQRPFHVGRGV